VSKKQSGGKRPDKGPDPGRAQAEHETAADPAVEAPHAPEKPPAEGEALGGSEQGLAPADVAQLREELAQAKDRALRIQAELENYRKRAARQIEEERRYANLPLIRDLLPVWDNMGRAIEAAEKTHETARLLEGFKMVSGQLESVLQQHQCTKIDALGEAFDPNVHEAISQQPCREHPANTVLGVVQTGFRLHDRVVRPSQVIVSVAVPRSEQAGESDEEAPEPGEGPQGEAAEANEE
jgi:molecular chaperone GrpE